MVQDPKLYPVDWHLNNNVTLTYNDPYSRKIHLFTMSTTALKNMGIKKPIDIVAHWAICVNGWVYELGRDPLQKKKKDQYGYKATPELKFVQNRKRQRKDIMYGEIGDLVYPYTPTQISEIAELVWQLSLKKKYVYDEYNCQVFIRLLVEIIGDHNAKANFPAFLDKWVKGAQNTRDGGSFAFAAGATLVAAGLTTWVVDGGATAAAGFAIAAQTTLRASAWLLTERDNRAKKIKEGQKKVKEQMRGRLPVVDY